MATSDVGNLSGSYSRNGSYFQQANLSNVHITLKESTVYNIRSEFPNHASSLYYLTLETLGLENNLSLAFDAFCAFIFVPEDIEIGVPLEKSGYMRISLTFSEEVDKNRVIMFFATTTGVIEIDSHRHVRCIVRALLKMNASERGTLGGRVQF